MPYDIDARTIEVARIDFGRITQEDIDILLPCIAEKEFNITVTEANALMKLVMHLFTNALLGIDYTEQQIKPIRTKFRDAGRRSAPWRPTSSRIPGRPQDGSDGNRINRWLLPVEHKFYADETTATLVEIKYYLQALSMEGAPQIPVMFRNIFTPWLVEHYIEPSAYLDPIQLVHIKLEDFIANPRLIQSGHVHPLDRGGRHEPSNTFLMLSQSNQIQGNNTMLELLDILRNIVMRHDEALAQNSQLERLIRQQ